MGALVDPIMACELNERLRYVTCHIIHPLLSWLPDGWELRERMARKDG